MKKLKRGKEGKYLSISIIFTDIHLRENPGDTEWFQSHLQVLSEMDTTSDSEKEMADPVSRSWR